MRTTLDIDSDVLDAARSLARQESISIGSAVSRLARRGLGTTRDVDYRGEFPSFLVAEGVSTFGTDDVKRALEEE
jgi:hypothetical protein